MGIVIRQSIWNTVLTYVGVVIGFVNAILLFPKALTTEELGLYALILQIALLYFQFSSIGTPNSILKFFPEFKKNDDLKKKLLPFLVVLALIGFIAMTAIYLLFKPFFLQLFSERSTLYFNFYEYAIPLAFVILTFSLISSYARALYHTTLTTLCRELIQKLITLILILIYAQGLISFSEFIIGMIINYALLTIIIWIFLAIKKEIHFNLNFYKGTNKFKEITRYSLYTFLGGISGTLYNYIDLIMIAMLLSLSAVGIYSRAVYLVVFITVPARALFQISHPLVAEKQTNNDISELEMLYKKSSVNIFLASSLLFILLWINIEFVFGLMPDEYLVGILPFLFLAIGRLIDVTCGINFQIMITSKYYKIDTLFNILLVVGMIALNLLLIPKYGMKGASIATMITFIVINLFRVVFLAVKMRIHPASKELLLAMGIAAICFVIGTIMPTFENVWMNLFYKSLIVIGLFGFLFMMAPGFKEAKGVLSKVISRLRV